MAKTAEPMRALSIQQPWLGAIILGDKRTENRDWPAPAWIIGEDIGLHASKKPDWGAPLYAWDAAGLVPPRVTWQTQAQWCRDNAGVLGAVLAVAAVTGCHHSGECMLPASCVPATGRTGCSPWAVRGQHHWIPDRVRPLAEPVPCRGALKLWPLPEDVEKSVRAQLEERDGT